MFSAICFIILIYVFVDKLEIKPTPLNLCMFYGYFSVYLASIYGHRTGVMTNMTISEADKSRMDAKCGDKGFVINVSVMILHL